MLILVRHGETTLNVGEERLRGWLPVPLDLKGMRQAEAVAKKLKGFKNAKAIYCSDLARAVQTAHEIGEELGMVIDPKEELRDWDYGEYTGKSAKESLPHLFSYMDVPTRKTPGGESFQTFLDRAMPFLKKHIESKDLVIGVSHNRICTLLFALLESKGKKPDMKVLKAKGPVEPGDYVVIHSDWKLYRP